AGPVAYHDLTGLLRMGFDDRLHASVVPVLVEMVAGELGPLAEHQALPSHLEARRNGRDARAVPALLPVLASIVKDGRPALGTHCDRVPQLDHRPPPRPLGHPAGQGGIEETGGEGLDEHGPEEVRVDPPPGEHRIAGWRAV